VRLAVGVLAHLHQIQHFINAGADFSLGQLVLFQAKGNVLGHGHVGEQGIALEHHVDRALVRLQADDILAIQNDFARGRGIHACQHAQQGGFAAAGTTQQAKISCCLMSRST
jgi:hypothetical protein